MNCFIIAAKSKLKTFVRLISLIVSLTVFCPIPAIHAIRKNFVVAKAFKNVALESCCF